jgi:hypothetical protein
MSKAALDIQTGMRLVPVTQAEIAEGLSDEVVEAVNTFEPLPFDAAHGATSWLRKTLEDGKDPLLTILALDPTEPKLCGFFVLGFTTILLAPDDRPIVEVAYKLKEPHAPQVAAEIAWIARSRETAKGFGRDLFDYSVLLAIDHGAIAMVVTPHDDETAEKLWIGRYRFRRPKQDPAGEPQSKLWYPSIDTTPPGLDGSVRSRPIGCFVEAPQQARLADSSHTSEGLLDVS